MYILVMEVKEIIIVDAYIKHPSSENLFCEQLEWFKTINIPVLVNSNAILSERVLNMVDYYFYDKKNLLFAESDFDEIDKSYYLFSDYKVKVRIENLNFQRHALSVLVNLFNTLHLAKSLGYTHFHRFEYDCVGGPNMASIVKEVSVLCKDKKGFVYMSNPYRVDDKSFKNSINPFYFYFEIDYFLRTITRIVDKCSYFEYLHQNNLDKYYLSYERYIAENIKQNDVNFRSNLVINHNSPFNVNQGLNNSVILEYFKDFLIDRSHSDNNYMPDEIYKRGYNICFCRFKMSSDSDYNLNHIAIYQDNHSGKEVNLRLVLYDLNNTIFETYDRTLLPYIKMWDVKENISKVEIYDSTTNSLIDTIYNRNVRNEMVFI